jgi:ribonuclease HI
MSILKIYTDGGSRGNPGVAGIGVHVEDESAQTIFETSLYLGEKTNNESEYQGLIAGLKWLVESLEGKSVEADQVEIFMDSKLVVEQINQNWKINQAHLRDLAKEVWQLLDKIKAQGVTLKLQHVRREYNKRADELANQAMDRGA